MTAGPGDRSAPRPDEAEDPARDPATIDSDGAGTWGGEGGGGDYAGGPVNSTGDRSKKPGRDPELA